MGLFNKNRSGKFQFAAGFRMSCSIQNGLTFEAGMMLARERAYGNHQLQATSSNQNHKLLTYNQEPTTTFVFVECRYCESKGRTGNKKCPVCRGIGRNLVRSTSSECPDCNGRGNRGQFICPECRGTGFASFEG